MGEQRQIRSRSWNRMPTKRCSANSIMNEFIVVDDDEVIILDFPESSKGKATGTSSRNGNQSILQRIISIDDDDDDDDGDDNMENVHKAGSSSNPNSFAANLQPSTEVHDDDDDDCQLVHEKSAAFRFSKCNQTFSTMPSSGVRYGLGSDSESDFSENDCSDCEILDGSHREVREQWEKAYLKKMKKPGRAGLSEEAGTSNPHGDTYFRPGFESRTEQHDQTSSFVPARDQDDGKETSSTFVRTEKSGKAGLRTDWREEAGPSDLHCDTNIRTGFESRTGQHGQTSSFVPARDQDDGKETSSTFVRFEKSGTAGLGTDMREEGGPSDLHCDANFRTGFESTTEQHDQTSWFFSARNWFFSARNPDGGRETSSTFFGTDDRNPNTPLSGSLEVEEDNRAKHSVNSRDFNKEDSPSPETRVEHERADSPSTYFTSPKEPIYQSSFKQGEKQPDEALVQPETSQMADKNEKKKVAVPRKNQKKKVAYQSSKKKVEEEEDASKSSLPQTSNGGGDTMPELDTQSNGTKCEHRISSLSESREPIIDCIPSTSGQVQGLHGTAPAVDIMLNREKLKETDEYKKAQEEEWESRQQQLQIQAEEAQRQRKRRKLEITRQLEMERRQKERVEEVRETQKKDEESMNMKEKVRAEITKSLKILELKCINMASLLRSLGIPVGGGTFPQPQEVHAAYKRAVLKFHPDRASRGDIRQQVEAEEKFKLIARMKDKFLS